MIPLPLDSRRLIFLFCEAGILYKNGAAEGGRRQSPLWNAVSRLLPPRMATKHTTVLFVDDDAGFLEVVLNLMTAYSEGQWDVHRFRPTIFVDTDTDEDLGFVEEAWIGETLTVGGATLQVTVNNGVTNSSGSAAVPAGGGSVTVTLGAAVAVTTATQTDMVLVGP